MRKRFSAILGGQRIGLLYKSHKSMSCKHKHFSHLQSKCQEIPAVHEIASGLFQGRDLRSIGHLRFQPRPPSSDALAFTRARLRPGPREIRGGPQATEPQLRKTRGKGRTQEKDEIHVCRARERVLQAVWVHRRALRALLLHAGLLGFRCRHIGSRPLRSGCHGSWKLPYKSVCVERLAVGWKRHMHESSHIVAF